MIERVLNNLISNAIHHTSGEGSIVIKAKKAVISSRSRFPTTEPAYRQNIWTRYSRNSFRWSVKGPAAYRRGAWLTFCKMLSRPTAAKYASKAN